MLNNKKLAIIGAMDCEVDILKSLLKDRREIQNAKMTVYTGTINGYEVIVSKSGVGKVNSAITTQYIIDTLHPDFILNTGVAGGIADNMSVGDIVIGTSLVQYDFNVSALGYARGYMCTGINKDKPTVYYSDENLINYYEKALKESGFKSEIHKGVIATGDTFISDNNLKFEIRDLFNAYAVEMEGCAIAQCAYVNNIPFVIVRAISDLANGDSPKSLETFEKIMAEVSAKTVETMLNYSLSATTVTI